MFSDIDYEKPTSTNRCMEFLYEHMAKYNNCLQDEEKITIVDPEEVDIDSCDELYLLMINDEQKYVCQTLFPLLKYVATLDWLKLKWSINPLKTDYD